MVTEEDNWLDCSVCRRVLVNNITTVIFSLKYKKTLNSKKVINRTELMTAILDDLKNTLSI